LGNILFRLSNALAYALEHNHKVEDYTLAFCNYHDGSSNIQFFEYYHPFHFFEYPRPRSRLINRIKWRFRDHSYCKCKMMENFDPSFNLKDLPSHSSYELKGFHFTAKDLVTKHRERICKILDFRSSLKSPVDSLFKEARSKYSLILGVHIRQNDFKDFYQGKYFVSSEHFLRLVDQFKNLKSEKSVGVLICSDSFQILKDIEYQNPDYIFPKGSVAGDMYSLSNCDYIIGPKATTMSAWAAFYGNVPILQVDSSTLNFSIKDFRNVKRLEPFSPFLN